MELGTPGPNGTDWHRSNNGRYTHERNFYIHHPSLNLQYTLFSHRLRRPDPLRTGSRWYLFRICGWDLGQLWCRDGNEGNLMRHLLRVSIGTNRRLPLAFWFIMNRIRPLQIHSHRKTHQLNYEILTHRSLLLCDSS
jgi:hypothetical protein